ncbi:unnamed protein product [Chondrus crispus]|uniref:Uncharacterized protein n=1 Tax=Chondrus crispus TaxID=2769 RepID=R7QRY7_CHOCR|nr:unnamed protein product [Chondrus crispus]CDF40894.1 unnamed protein product [Chondrus crispus]|eukprot:XP_005711188.1 unnamed protein product [Chondrus crispus]
MQAITARQIFWGVTTSAFVASAYWGSFTIPAAYESDGRAGALLMTLVVCSIFLLVLFIGFLVLEVSEELAGNEERRNAKAPVAGDMAEGKKAS